MYQGTQPTPAEALAAYQRGYLSLTDMLCHILLATGSQDPLVYALAGLVSLEVREYKRAVGFLTAALRSSPGDTHLMKALDQARKGAREQALIRPDGRKRYLVIKAWGCGFCSDLDHVLGGLLLAEITGRIPVVHWGRSSLFRDDPDVDSWVHFFEPVSNTKVEDLIGKKHSYFPPKWNDENFFDPDVNKFSGAWARMGPELFMNRREDVAVSDFHLGLGHVQSWCRPGTPYFEKPASQVYRAIVKKYLRPSTAVRERVESFAAEHFGRGKVIGVHVRGGDKPVEDPVLSERNKETPTLIDELLAKHPDARIFLLTDDAKLRQEYGTRYGDRLVSTECLRTPSAHGLHYLPHESRARLGIEVMVDMYLAARCDYFLGVGTSNVSAMIEHLKDWPAGAYNVRPWSIHYVLNPFLYKFELSEKEQADLMASLEAQRRREQEGV